ncbi:MAG: hypothetical protein A3G20_00850 [Acidobacteria bacterium RIFCSPLOWO2_12_FULL_59_11]|nr:MAG: hypothetical protein A3G20_00850 [Acidobacteria bacterium RIFCSPLOWO2_12_FULL_59_11]
MEGQRIPSRVQLVLSETEGPARSGVEGAASGPPYMGKNCYGIINCGEGAGSITGQFPEGLRKVLGLSR